MITSTPSSLPTLAAWSDHELFAFSACMYGYRPERMFGGIFEIPFTFDPYFLHPYGTDLYFCPLAARSVRIFTIGLEIERGLCDLISVFRLHGEPVNAYVLCGFLRSSLCHIFNQNFNQSCFVRCSSNFSIKVSGTTTMNHQLRF